ncbi:Tat proofreading chaperone DmsD [Pluralibacter sp.]|jgi:TorA maturation chaperone TorD|uniref:Tat proofreading chaperone DmsD n=1 Tax=Pluralibacter sp. TaxID=1920032 RepID=UPI0025FFD934|nr:Tat proofreading chaperone DmsD [Pluralibacter sp.]MBV8041353.1 Tat proofreading chaperone DmsD [Pluralibacter sp.]
MTTRQQGDAFAFTARILGALFYFAPDSEQAAPLVSAFTDGSWTEQWPVALPEADALAARFRAPCDETLPEAFQRLFVGPWALPAPPWGSVWLDRENVLFGDSTLALRQWMRENGIAFDSAQNEPEDHFGTLLMLGAWLRENSRDDAWQQLMAWHVLPWANRFLQTFVLHASHPFYLALGQLTQHTLQEWQSQLLIPVAKKTLFR